MGGHSCCAASCSTHSPDAFDYFQQAAPGSSDGCSCLCAFPGARLGSAPCGGGRRRSCVPTECVTCGLLVRKMTVHVRSVSKLLRTGCQQRTVSFSDRGRHARPRPGIAVGFRAPAPPNKVQSSYLSTVIITAPPEHLRPFFFYFIFLYLWDKRDAKDRYGSNRDASGYAKPDHTSSW